MNSSANDHVRVLLDRIDKRAAVVGVIGLGYVGLPLAVATASAGFTTIGFDTDPQKLQKISNHVTYIDSVDEADLARHVRAGTLTATGDMARLADCDIIIICVPTPLNSHREPDLQYVVATAETIAACLRPAQVVILESTTYPGTTSELLIPTLEESGLACRTDFFVGFSPEREDPGNKAFATAGIPKVVSGDGEAALEIVRRFYGAVVAEVVPVSSTATAEAVKITENIFRAVNIALVNELKTVFDAMDVDVWEVIEAAKTKPFGYMAFYPGPGLGGHCVPIDPFYLTWRAKELDITTRFIELAGEVNRAMPAYIVSRLEAALDRAAAMSLGSARILLIGVAYKKNVSDIREGPAFKIMQLLDARGTEFEFHDPHVAVIASTRAHEKFAGRVSTELNAQIIAGFDAVVIVTDHDAVDYTMLGEHARLIVDTRNAMESRRIKGPVIKA
jgi:UDP-N-acetyl-D-glucosamine dehydrogenase